MNSDRYPTAHPVRRAVLRMLEAENGPLAVVEMRRRMAPVFEALGLPAPSLGTVSYHVRMLADRDLIACVKLERRRGSVAHHYALVDGVPPAAIDSDLMFE